MAAIEYALLSPPGFDLPSTPRPPPRQRRTAMESFEFTPDQNNVLASLARRLTFVGMLIILTGVGRVVLTLVRGQGEGLSLTVIILLLISLVNIVIGVILWRPSDNFRRIATTEGRDIPELMTALNELSAGFNLLQYLLLGGGVLAIIGLLTRR